MALNFYLNEININNKINVQTNASFTSKVGEFDVGTLDLEWNKTKNKIAPQTKLFIEDTTLSDVWSFVVLNDEVEIVKKTPKVIYIHHLTVTQNTYELMTHLVRNSVFSQPFAPKISKLKASLVSTVTIGGSLENPTYTQNNTLYLTYRDAYQVADPDYYQETQKIFISKREKIKRIYLDITTYTSAYQRIARNNTEYFVTEPREYKKNIYSLLNFLIIKYDESNNVIGQLPITASDGTNIIELSSSFFEKNYYYEVKLDTNNLSTIQSLGGTSDISFEYDEVDVVLPTIQTLLTCSLAIETYYYSLADVLEILRDQTKKTYNGASTFADFYNVELDEDVIAPDLTFTSQDLWSCVSETLKYIDAIPFIDENNNLVPEYLNDYSRTPIDIKRVDEKSSLSNEYYTNSLISNYQNGRQENGIFYPARNVFKRVSSKVYGVPGPNDYQMNVDNPIDYIDKAWVKITNNGYDYIIKFSTNAPITKPMETDELIPVKFLGKLPWDILDISDVIYEQSIYSLLPMGDEDSSDPNQLNTLYYEKGSTSIYLGGVRDAAFNLKYEVYKKAIALCVKNLFGLPLAGTISGESYVSVYSGLAPSIEDLQYSILYHAVFDGRVSQESTITKHPGETYATQEQGNVDLNRMGNNMQGLIARLGNEKELVTIPVTDYGSRIRKGSLWVDDDGKKYIANSVKTTFSTRSSKVMVEVQFSRNFNLISQYTKINQERRFYEIKESLVNKGYENIVEYLYFSLNEIENDSPAYNGDAIDILIKDNFIKPSFAKKADFSVIDTYQYENNEGETKGFIYIPFHAYGLGNSICFEMGFESPINAGDSLQGSGTLLNKATLYTAGDGFADKVNLRVYTRNVDAVRLAYDSFPNLTLFVTMALLHQEVSEIINISQYYYYKKPNEILHVNYSIAFMPAPNQDIFFGNVLIDKNSIIQGVVDNNPSKTFYLYAGDEWYSIIDNKVLSTHTRIGPVTINYNRANNDLKGSISFTCDPTIASAKAWAIADANGNIYFAVNQELENTNTVTLYFAARRFRIN